MASKVYPGYYQVHIPNQLNFNPTVKIPPVIIRAKLYLYATQKDINHPDAKIKIVADIWHAPGTLKRGKSQLIIHYYPRCEVDIDNNTIISNRGVLPAVNTEDMIEELRKAIFS